MLHWARLSRCSSKCVYVSSMRHTNIASSESLSFVDSQVLFCGVSLLLWSCLTPTDYIHTHISIIVNEKHLETIFFFMWFGATPKREKKRDLNWIHWKHIQKSFNLMDCSMWVCFLLFWSWKNWAKWAVTTHGRPHTWNNMLVLTSTANIVVMYYSRVVLSCLSCYILVDLESEFVIWNVC